MRKNLFFLIIFLIINNSSFSKENISSEHSNHLCDSKSDQKYIEEIYKLKIKKIEIDMNNYRRWTVNSIRILTNNFRFTPDKYKRRFDANILVTYENNIQCSFKGQVRHSGDAKDHIKLQGNSLIQSLDVHLDEGHIKGITKFKLYLPGTRGVVVDEILQSEILRSLNYISPRTFNVNARINKSETIMMMQEKAAKELLEYNNRREGPILEGDQRFFFRLVNKIPDNQISNASIGTPELRSKSIKTMLTKQSNSTIIFKSENHKTMSYKALSNLNLIYLYYSNKFQDQKNNFNFFDYDLDNSLLGFFNPENILKLDVYNLLMQATNSQHALSVSNRKFYWNSIEKYFEPINYDSNIEIDRQSPTTTTSILRMPISKYFYQSFDLLEKKLVNLNLNKIHNNILLSGINLSRDDLNSKINKILFNLNIIKENYLNLDKDIVKHNNFEPINNILNTFNDTLNQIDPTVFLVKHNQRNGKLQRCKIYLEKCEDYSFSKENLLELLEGEFILDKKVYQYLGDNLDFKNIIEHENHNKLNFKKSTIYYDDGIEIDNNDENLLNIYQKKSGSRVYIINGTLENLTINFFGHEIAKNENDSSEQVFPNNYPIDINGLTGCLSLINLKVKNISIKATESSCEDTINLINVEGSLAEINIKNSLSDGLDIDFSDVQIEKINISSSGNDCVDFSSGNYKLNKLSLINCGDKALSVGEKSFLVLNEIFAENSNFGIASKDSSVTKINNAYLKNLKTCVSAYKKKQEFYGGFLEIKNIDCKNYKNKKISDTVSKIVIENEL